MRSIDWLMKRLNKAAVLRHGLGILGAEVSSSVRSTAR